jgi:hypothetical protein
MIWWQRKEKKVRGKQRNREEVARISRKEVMAEVFLERMQRRVAEDERREAEDIEEDEEEGGVGGEEERGEGGSRKEEERSGPGGGANVEGG